MCYNSGMTSNPEATIPPVSVLPSPGEKVLKIKGFRSMWEPHIWKRRVRHREKGRRESGARRVLRMAENWFIPSHLIGHYDKNYWLVHIHSSLGCGSTSGPQKIWRSPTQSWDHNLFLQIVTRGFVMRRSWPEKMEGHLFMSISGYMMCLLPSSSPYMKIVIGVNPSST